MIGAAMVEIGVRLPRRGTGSGDPVSPQNSSPTSVAARARRAAQSSRW
jgi:hypothetical protein